MRRYPCVERYHELVGDAERTVLNDDESKKNAVGLGWWGQLGRNNGTHAKPV